MDNLKRLNSIIEKNKKINSTYISNILKSDFYYLINNYFEVDFDNIKINVNEADGQYLIGVECVGDRIKIAHNID